VSARSSFAGRRRVLYLVGVAILTTSPSGLADPNLARGPHDPASVFLVAKSENKNQVHYGVRLDQDCNVVGTNPLYGYWRMLEKKGEIEPILSREVRAYGLAPVQRIEKTGDATTIYARMNAIPDRQLRVTVERTATGCAAQAAMPIAGADAQLRLIYIRLSWPFGVDYVLLRGSRTADGHTVEEKI
jgi:Domain of unknown function (DUF4833)